jgi:hypothetical protein
MVEANIPMFLIGCMGTRLLLVYLAKSAGSLTLSVMGWLALLIAVGFITLYFTGWRKVGPETLGKPIWWNNLRPVHALLYATFAWLAITGQPNHAWKVLLADVIIGFTGFTVHHTGILA